jgi:hypothetical protein
MKNEYFLCLHPLDPETESPEGKLTASPSNYHLFQKLAPSRLPHAHAPPSTALTRGYLRSLRAAEMAAWEMSGGDYLLPSFAA